MTKIRNNEILSGIFQDRKFWRSVFKKTMAVVFILLLFPILLFIVPKFAEVFLTGEKYTGSVNDSLIEVSLKKLNTEINALNKKIDKLEPSSGYLVINTTENRFMLFKNKKMIREGLCSTGSLINLEGEGNKKWIFKTPRGIHKVRNKVTDPIWKKPDWAFVEEGLPVPSPNHPSRLEPYVLGAYALILGDGYMIHGTIYQRFIGMPVTHGCVRLLDDDLEIVYKTLQIGSLIYIY